MLSRMGEDQSVLFSIHRKGEILRQIDLEVTEKTLLTDTIRRIKNADSKHSYKKIYIDDGGMGVGVFDPLLEDQQTKRKVVAINNSARSIDLEDKQHKKLLKEDLYNNLLRLMEQKKIELKEDAEV